ncbi:MAG: aspartate--tRNA ligase [Candidatus Liptonbacteria bacterium]|nr:aspartate--tRNA ligase [Candidatus Liptonbacteria bacterium]
MRSGRVLARDAVHKEGDTVELAGWVDARRDHGKIIFIDLRDRSGVMQVVFSPNISGASDLRLEYVIRARGVVKKRPPAMVNDKIPTGEYELQASSLEILGKAGELPIPVTGDGYDVNEESRLKYRYLDLRRKRLKHNIELRHRVTQFVRAHLSERGFIEIETPLLTKSTPEGSRDFIVPSRLEPGKFYALPQSPQQYKQLLMCAGFERYFQIARALRDEDLRADRGFEHTQIDIEMSFVEQEDVMEAVEELVISIFERFGKRILKKPLPKISYEEALKTYGADKFDPREQKDKDVVGLAWVKDFPVFVRDEKTGALTYSHNPFTAPKPEDEEKLLKGKDLEKLVSLQYDLVCNGYEIGGGGIRVSKPEVLEKVFEVIGHKKADIQKQFGHMLEAFRYGAPPHGGIALGLDRIIMILTGEESLREVVAFPMTSGGGTSVMDAPSEVSKGQLDELGLEIKKAKKKHG